MFANCWPSSRSRMFALAVVVGRAVGFVGEMPTLPALVHPQPPRRIGTRRAAILPRRPTGDRNHPDLARLGALEP